MKRELPSYYWDFIMDYLPNYSRRDDVLKSDIYTRYLDGEVVAEEDIQQFFENKSREVIEKEYLSDEWGLFLEAFKTFADPRYSDRGDTNPALSNLECLGNKAIIPPVDGAFYINYPMVFEVNDLLVKRLGAEQFIFEVTGAMDDEKMQHFNNLFKTVKRKGLTCHDIATADRMNYLKEIGCDLQFIKPVRDVARVNLIKCGGLEMPTIVGAMLKEFYYENSTGRTSMVDCIEYLAENDIVGYGFDDLDATYRAKIANLLLCTFTGMRLGSQWNGRQEVNGGYIVVKNNGDVVAFHSAIADEFKDFLVAKMVMESPSHSRHKDMVIYKEDGKYYLKLALQLRFTLNR